MEEQNKKNDNDIKRFNIVISNTSKVIHNILSKDYSNLIDDLTISKNEKDDIFSFKISIFSKIFNGFNLDIVLSNSYMKDTVDVYINETIVSNKRKSSGTVKHFDYMSPLDLQASVIEINKYISENYLDPEKNDIIKMEDEVLRQLILVSYFIPLDFHGLVDNVYDAIKTNIQFNNEYLPEIIIEKINNLDSNIIESLRTHQHMLVTHGPYSVLLIAPFRDRIMINLSENITSETSIDDIEKLVSVEGEILKDPLAVVKNPLSSLLGEIM